MQTYSYTCAKVDLPQDEDLLEALGNESEAVRERPEVGRKESDDEGAGAKRKKVSATPEGEEDSTMVHKTAVEPEAASQQSAAGKTGTADPPVPHLAGVAGGTGSTQPMEATGLDSHGAARQQELQGQKGGGAGGTVLPAVGVASSEVHTSGASSAAPARAESSHAGSAVCVCVCVCACVISQLHAARHPTAVKGNMLSALATAPQIQNNVYMNIYHACMCRYIQTNVFM